VSQDFVLQVLCQQGQLVVKVIMKDCGPAPV